MIITLVFEKNAFFAENCRVSQNIVITTSTPGRAPRPAHPHPVLLDEPLRSGAVRRAQHRLQHVRTEATLPGEPRSLQGRLHVTRILRKVRSDEFLSKIEAYFFCLKLKSFNSCRPTEF
jgi:hypothetical protein